MGCQWSTEISQVMSMMQSSPEHTKNGLNFQKLKNDKSLKTAQDFSF
jgi:hypothetical protein